MYNRNRANRTCVCREVLVMRSGLWDFIRKWLKYIKKQAILESLCINRKGKLKLTVKKERKKKWMHVFSLLEKNTGNGRCFMDFFFSTIFEFTVSFLSINNYVQSILELKKKKHFSPLVSNRKEKTYM